MAIKTCENCKAEIKLERTDAVAFIALRSCRAVNIGVAVCDCGWINLDIPDELHKEHPQ